MESLEWSPDGTRILGANIEGRGIKIWNSSSGQILLNNIRGIGFVRATWNLDGTQIAVTDLSGGLAIYNAATGQSIQRPNLIIVEVDWSPDGSKLLTTDYYGNNVLIVNSTNGRVLNTLTGHSASVGSLEWSPDGNKIASGSNDGNVRVWNASSGQQLLSLSAHTGYVTSVAWNPDNLLLATTGVDGKLRIWDTATEEVICQISTEGFIYDSAWNPDGTALAYGGASSTVGLVLPFPNADSEPSGQTANNADFGICATPTTTRPLASDGEVLPLIPSPSELTSTLVPSPEATP
jgi:WD40 repeat protein